MKKHLVSLAASVVVLATQQLASASGDPAFAEANRAYAAGDFKKAVDGYEQLVKFGTWSANLFYDLGNASYRAGDAGRAMLNYERALVLEPHHPEADANLRLVRDQAHALELRKTPVERYLSFGSANQFAIAAAVAFWITMFLAAWIAFSRGRKSRRVALLLFSGAVCIAAAFGAYTAETGARGRGLAIVLGKNIEARVATADNAGSVLALPAGSEVKVLSARGDWIYAALPNDQRGWIPANAAEPVRL